MTPEEHKRRGDAADELFREMKRQIAEKLREDVVVTARPVQRRHWRSYGTEPLPTPAEALAEPFSAFPSWFLRVECDRCGKVPMVNESHCQVARSDVADDPREDAARRLRRARRQGGAVDRHRGRVQPTGAKDRAEELSRARVAG